MNPSPKLTSSVRQAWDISRLPTLAWIAICVLVLSLRKDGWHIFATTCGSFYDAGNYTKLAVDGYENGDIMSAFYPLWPLVMGWLSFGSGDMLAVGRVGALTAAAAFVAATYLVIRWTTVHGFTRYQRLGLALMILSPLSVFRVLAFTESLFSLFLMLLIAEVSNERPRQLWIAIWSMVLSLTRPLFPILMIASALLAVFFYGTDGTHNKSTSRNLLPSFATIFWSAPLGYLPYGYYCWQKFGNFWLPFVAQKFWNRSFGFHWDIIFNPKVINGSNEVLVWDLLAFYTPFLLAIWFLWDHLRKKDIARSAPCSAAIGLAILIAAAHSALAFLTHDRFMSLSRHVLANPCVYISAVALAQNTYPASDSRIQRVGKFLIFASVIFLAMWWVRFLKDQWIG